MTASWDCHHRGHHYHEDSDGAVFNRRRVLGDSTPYPVTCCHCGMQATYSGYAERREFIRAKSVLCAKEAA